MQFWYLLRKVVLCHRYRCSDTLTLCRPNPVERQLLRFIYNPHIHLTLRVIAMVAASSRSQPDRSKSSPVAAISRTRGLRSRQRLCIC